MVAAHPSADERRIREVVAEASRVQSDIDALIALHTPDAVVVNFPGRRILGRTALAEAMASALRSSLAEVHTTVDVVDVRFPSTDVALVSCVKTVHDSRRPELANALPATSGALTYLMVERDGQWLIALAQTTPVLSTPPSRLLPIWPAPHRDRAELPLTRLLHRARVSDVRGVGRGFVPPR